MSPLEPAAIRLVRPRWLLASLFAHLLAFALVQGPAPLKKPAPRLEVRLASRTPAAPARPAAPRLAAARQAAPVQAMRAVPRSESPVLPPAAPPSVPTPPVPVANPAPASSSPAPAPAISIPSTPVAAGAEDALAGYGASFARWLARHKAYPRLALMRGWQGQVRLRVRVAKKGAVMAVEIASSSGFEVLDREAEALVRRADPLPELPLSLAGREFTLEIPVVFRLEQAS